MEDPRKEILNRVARGEISPEEGATLLDDLASGRATTATAPPTGPTASRIRVRCAFGSIIIEGDPSVREAEVTGRHSARREGDTLLIEGDTLGSGEFAFVWAGRRQIRLGRPEHAHPLRVRVNPELPLEVEAQAGTLRLAGVRGPIKASVQAGSARLEGFEGPLDLEVQAGSVRGEGRLSKGSSRIRCEAGAIRIGLKSDSSVRINGKSALGTVQVDGGSDDNGTWVIGGGEATLDVEAIMGSVRVDAS
jgi:hypothetical protein